MSVEAAGLVDLLDRLLDTGASVDGDLTLAVADIDLVRVKLRTLLASVEAEQRQPGQPRVEWTPPPPRRRRRRPASASLPTRIDADPDRLERGLAQLVLVVADLLRELLERQAMRRIQAGTLTRPEIERLSVAFEALDDRLEQLATEGFARAGAEQPERGDRPARRRTRSTATSQP